MSKLSYVRYILVFKMWKKTFGRKDQKIKINKLAKDRLLPPPDIAIRTGIIKKLLPKIPPWTSEITMFLMKTKFCFKTKATLLLETVSLPKYRLNIDDYKPPFFEDVNDDNHDDEDDEDSSYELIEDLLLSFRSKASSQDLIRMANVTKSPPNNVLEIFPDFGKTKTVSEFKNTIRIDDSYNLKQSPNKNYIPTNIYVQKMIARSNFLRQQEKEKMQKSGDMEDILDKTKTEMMSPVPGCSKENNISHNGNKFFGKDQGSMDKGSNERVPKVIDSIIVFDKIEKKASSLSPLDECSNENESIKTVPKNHSYLKVNHNIEERSVRKETGNKRDKYSLEKTCEKDEKNLSKTDLSTQLDIFNFEIANNSTPTRIEQKTVNLPNIEDNFNEEINFFRDVTNCDWCLPDCPNDTVLSNFEMILDKPPMLHEEDSNSIDFNNDKSIKTNYGLSNYDAPESSVKSVASLPNLDTSIKESRKFLTQVQKKEVLITDSPPRKKALFEENISDYMPLGDNLVSAPIINETKLQNDQQNITQKTNFKSNIITTFDSKYLMTTSELSGVSLDCIFGDEVSDMPSCSQTFENHSPDDPNFNDQAGGINQIDKSASSENYEIVDYFPELMDSAQPDEVPSPLLSATTGSVCPSDYKDQAIKEDEKTQDIEWYEAQMNPTPSKRAKIDEAEPTSMETAFASSTLSKQGQNTAQ